MCKSKPQPQSVVEAAPVVADTPKAEADVNPNGRGRRRSLLGAADVATVASTAQKTLLGG